MKTQFKILILMIMILIALPALAIYRLNGYMSDNEDDGSFYVTVLNDYGHPYNGTAYSNDDGTLTLTVVDDKGESYSGIAIKNTQGTFDLTLHNDDDTSLIAIGKIEIE